ncbi:hypothetical protein CDAR_46441 [Caerostris darwini]|uniref:Uncharacterized protein n=1 Tax=Caerostris darwini TaxID=1538125 RepID=A0AAV4S6X4_9ARAC|nr:hypothetical protein CDAR_46441 [Caerostris darwini]
MIDIVLANRMRPFCESRKKNDEQPRLGPRIEARKLNKSYQIMKEAQLTVSNSFPGGLHGIGEKISNHYQHHQSNRGKKTDRGISISKHIDFEDSDATLEVPTTSPKTQRRVVD